MRMFERHSEKDDWRDKVHFGAVLTGAARIFCRTYRDNLVRECGQIGGQVVGGEMEGAGILSASEPDNPTWMVVKGISDFADEDRDSVVEEARTEACKNAATFVLQALQHTEHSC